MSAALRLARQMAAKDISWIEAVIHDGQREQRINAAKATLDAIDAAIAAETPATTEISINLGDGQSVTLNVSATDLQNLTEALSRGRRVRPFADWTEQELRPAIRALEDAIAAQAPAKETKPLRIPIEFDTSGLEEALRNAAKDRVSIELDLGRPSITVNGNPLDAARVVKCLLAQDVDLATCGIATGTAPLCVVGEHARESVDLSSAVSDFRKLLDWKDADAYSPADDLPRLGTIYLGDTVEVVTEWPEAGVIRSLGKVVEIFEGKGGDDMTYRVEIDRAPNHRLDLESFGLEAKRQVVGALVKPGQLRRL